MYFFEISLVRKNEEITLFYTKFGKSLLQHPFLFETFFHKRGGVNLTDYGALGEDKRPTVCNTLIINLKMTSLL
jgi:hypothetical protein